MGRLGRILRRLGGVLGRFGGVLGCLEGILEASWATLEASWFAPKVRDAQRGSAAQSGAELAHTEYLPWHPQANSIKRTKLTINRRQVLDALTRRRPEAQRIFPKEK